MFAAVNQAILSVIAGKAPRHHLRQVLVLGLRGLGATRALAEAMSALSLPTVHIPSLDFDAGD